MKRLGILAIVLAGAATFAAPATATTVIPLSTSDMAEISTIIVDATVSQTVVKLDEYPEQNTRRINTHVTVKVGDWLKTPDGEPVEEETVTLLNPGGSLLQPQKVTSQIPGAPELKQGQRAIFFLWKNPFDEYRIVGLAQGYVPVKSSADTGQHSVAVFKSKDGESPSLKHADHAGESADAGAQVKNMPLPVYKSYVRACVRTHRGEKAIDPTTGEELVLEKNPLLEPWRNLKSN